MSDSLGPDQARKTNRLKTVYPSKLRLRGGGIKKLSTHVVICALRARNRDIEYNLFSTARVHCSIIAQSVAMVSRFLFVRVKARACAVKRWENI